MELNTNNLQRHLQRQSSGGSEASSKRLSKSIVRLASEATRTAAARLYYTYTFYTYTVCISYSLLAAYLSIGATLGVSAGALQAAISSGNPSTDSTEQFSLLAS